MQKYLIAVTLLFTACSTSVETEIITVKGITSAYENGIFQIFAPELIDGKKINYDSDISIKVMTNNKILAGKSIIATLEYEGEIYNLISYHYENPPVLLSDL